MSHTVMTAAFGPARRFGGEPKWVQVLADYIVGGSGVMVFHDLDLGRRVRIRPDAVSDVDALVAGFALVAGVDCAEAAPVAEALLSSKADIVLTAEDAAALRSVVTDLGVSVVVTNLTPSPVVSAEDLAGLAWEVRVSYAQSVGDTTAH